VTQREFFEKVLSVLDTLGVQYMIVGSVGSMLYGEPRLTNDMDVVLELRPDKVASLAAAFPSPQYYFPPPAAVLDAIARRGQFNVIHVESGSKVDLVVRKDDAFAREEFSRRQKVAFSERMDCVSARPEDLIVAKLRSYRAGGSEKHLRDVRAMLFVVGRELDMTHIEKWVKVLDLSSQWEVARSRGLQE
jgi:hypothetical protein